MYHALRGFTRFGPLPWKYWRVWLCERMGWTLEYVDRMDYYEVRDVIAVLQSRDKAVGDDQRKASMAQRMRRRR